MASNQDMATIAFRVNRATKEAAEELFGTMGMSVGTAINLFLAQSVHDWGLPFQPKMNREPNTRLEEALAESEEIMRGKRKTRRYDGCKKF